MVPTLNYHFTHLKLQKIKWAWSFTVIFFFYQKVHLIIWNVPLRVHLILAFYRKCTMFKLSIYISSSQPYSDWGNKFPTRGTNCKIFFWQKPVSFSLPWTYLKHDADCYDDIPKDLTFLVSQHFSMLWIKWG